MTGRGETQRVGLTRAWAYGAIVTVRSEVSRSPSIRSPSSPPTSADGPAFRRIGLPDAFLDAGALPTLHNCYGVSTQAISQQIKGWL